MHRARLEIQKHPPEVLYKKGVLKNFAKFGGKHLCQSLFIQKTSGRLLLETLREKCPNTEYFLVRIFLYSD